MSLVEVPRGGGAPELTLRLNPTTTGTLVLHDEKGNPVPKGFRIEVWPTYDQHAIITKDDIAVADDQGAIKIGGVIPGLTYYIRNYENGRLYRAIQERRVQLVPGPSPLSVFEKGGNE